MPLIAMNGCPGDDCALTQPTMPVTYEPLYQHTVMAGMSNLSDIPTPLLAALGAAVIGYVIAPLPSRKLKYAAIAGGAVFGAEWLRKSL